MDVEGRGGKSGKTPISAAYYCQGKVQGGRGFFAVNGGKKRGSVPKKFKTGEGKGNARKRIRTSLKAYPIGGSMHLWGEQRWRPGKKAY